MYVELRAIVGQVQSWIRIGSLFYDVGSAT